ncbi:MAG: hypothetical protein ACD_52C00026G0003 [uncultured bacterium]|nr:MAG: hypothetical protein ACD_52C00026G0003 [uncultured bacterium]
MKYKTAILLVTSMPLDTGQDWDPTQTPPQPTTVEAGGGQIRVVNAPSSIPETGVLHSPTAQPPSEKVTMNIDGKQISVVPFQDNERKGQGYYYDEQGNRVTVEIKQAATPGVTRSAPAELKRIGDISTAASYLEGKRLAAISEMDTNPNELTRITNLIANYNMGNAAQVRQEIDRDIAEEGQSLAGTKAKLKPIGQLPGDDEYQKLKSDIRTLQGSRQVTTDPLQLQQINMDLLHAKSDLAKTERGVILQKVATLDGRIQGLNNLKSTLK